MSQEFLDLSQLNNIFGKDQVQEKFGTPEEVFTKDSELTPKEPETIIGTGGEEPGAIIDNLIENPEGSPEGNPDGSPDDNLLEPPTSVLPSQGLNQVVSTLIKSGEWEDLSIKFGDKEYNSIEELMGEHQISLDLFNELLDNQKEIKNEKISSSYLKIDNPDDIKTNLAKAILQGQDYTELLNEKENTIDPISSLDFSYMPNDLEDKTRAENDAANLLIWHHENNLGYNLQDEFVKKALFDKINSLRDSHELLDTAESVKQGVILQFNESIKERMAADAALKQAQAVERKQEIKKYKETLKTKGYTDNFIKDATALRYEEDRNTSTPQYLSVIKDKVNKDPDFATEILHFLLDKEGYLESKRLPEKLNTQRRMIEVSGKAKKPASGSQTIVNKPGGSESDDLIMKIFG